MAGKKAKRGRRSSYEDKIAPYLTEIRAMYQAGVPQTKICEMLGVSRSAWDRCKTANSELIEALQPRNDQGGPKNAPPGNENTPDAEQRAQNIKALEAAMMQIAQGFTRKQVRFFSTRDGIEDVVEEVYYPPNFQALRFLLMNWGGYMSEPAAQAQREKEFAHKKAMDEKNNW